MKMTEYLKTPEAAALLKCSPRTLEKMRITGRGPAFYKIGRLVAYTPDTLQEWLDVNKRRSTREVLE
jgi:hypothetical protein